MTKEMFCKLAEELGRDPTDDEMADAMADLIDYARERHQEELTESPSNCDICGEPVPRGLPMCQTCYEWLRYSYYPKA